MTESPRKSMRIGWVGTGVMGGSMVGHLIARGYPVSVFNRTQAKAQSAIDRGAQWRENPGQVAEEAEVIFSMVGFPGDVEEIYFGAEGLLRGVRPGSVLVDMTTTRPSLALRIYAEAKQQGVHALDAPVSGGDIGARNATLCIMSGGDRDVFDRVKPLLEVMGRTLVYTGGPGSGQHTKMSNQVVIAGAMIGVCEGLLYGHRAGLDPQRLLEAISGGAAGSWSLSNLAPRMVHRDFNPGFYVEHFVKDMEIALEEAARMNLCLPGLALVHQLYQAVQAQGHQRKGTQALLLALERLSCAEGK